MTAAPLELPLAPPEPGISRAEWLRLARRARWLSWASLAYMGVEGAVALAAGLVAGSIALIGFGIDSVIEGFASLVIVWRFTGARLHSQDAERRAQRLVAIQFFVLAPYIAVHAVLDLAGGDRPEVSWIGIALAASSVVLMPVLGVAKQRIGSRMGSVATQGEGAQNLLCAYMAGALLVGLAGNAAFGLWWLDPVAALAIAALAVREGVESWRGESCCSPSDAGPFAACTLDAPGMGDQLDRYRRLGAAATAVDLDGRTLTVGFGADVDERLLNETIEVERGCCAFLELDYRVADRRLTIAVGRDGDAQALEALRDALAYP